MLKENSANHVIGFAASTVNKGAALVGSSLRLVGLRKLSHATRQTRPGDTPGIDHLPNIDVVPPAGAVQITCIDYSVDRIETHEVDDLDAFLGRPVPEWVGVRWVNICGLYPYTVNQFRQHYKFHTLAAEDVLHVPQRPKAELYDDYVFVIVRMLRLIEALQAGGDAGANEPNTLETEQVSLFLYEGVLLSIQEMPGDVWDPIRNRLKLNNTYIRKSGASYLLYALLDAIVDYCFPVLEHYGDVIDDLELMALENPTPALLHRINGIKRELGAIRRIVWPTREVINRLHGEDQGHIGDDVKPFLQDVYEHTIQLVEIIESYRELAAGLTDLYMSATSNRMNEIMKVLTMMASVFIPLTFLAGVYGMNFQYMPELRLRWAYPTLLAVFLVLIVAMLLYFRRKGWIGKQ